jgi:hypothetical protein
MKRIWVLIAVASLVALSMNTPVHAEVHKSTGQVVKVNAAKGAMELVEKGRRHKLVMDKGTKFVDEEGQPLKGLKAIQTGDYVREECSFRKDGPSVAKKITILKRAAEVGASPEK